MLGLDFIAFGDPLDRLTPEKWETLKKACAAGSDAKFLAQPGMVYTDDAARKFPLCSGDFAWPTPAFLSPDGKRLIKQSFWFDVAKMGFCGPYDIQSSKAGWWSYGVFQAWGISTTMRASPTFPTVRRSFNGMESTWGGKRDSSMSPVAFVCV